MRLTTQVKGDKLISLSLYFHSLLLMACFVVADEILNWGGRWRKKDLSFSERSESETWQEAKNQSGRDTKLQL
jgi:hypothetical protein